LEHWAQWNPSFACFSWLLSFSQSCPFLLTEFLKVKHLLNVFALHKEKGNKHFLMRMGRCLLWLRYRLAVPKHLF
jgi:hypothetical protein